jgi:hypothetical protein
MFPFPSFRPALLARVARCAVLVALLGAAPLRADVSKEYQIKAGFLYNFTKFIEWPSDRFASEKAPIVIAVLGDNPFGDELRQVIEGRKVNGRAIVIESTQSLEEAKRAHVVFIGADAEKRLENHLDSLHAAGVLTVGESKQLAALGGTIVFTVVDDKVRFEINVASAERAGLKISAQLLKLALGVRGRP